MSNGVVIFETLDHQLVKARARLWKAQQRFNCFPNINIIINDSFGFNFSSQDIFPVFEYRQEPYLKCAIPDQLLSDILTRKAHWNNAEIGCLIRFNRVPNVYLPDVHTLMSFFHT